MADGSQELQRFTELLAQRIKEALPIQTIWATVKSVDWNEKTMTATGVTNELDYENVLLGTGWEYKKPKVGSKCLLGIMENNGAITFLINAETVEEVKITVNEATIEVTPTGIKIEREGENLFQCLSDMIAEINKIIVLYGTSINVTAMETIKTRINKILI
ncbi:hypothetical protein [Flavobacterium beibuense]|uniref:hypothetical protein n=1 Tax=Flavobacterium beibuense TaxID=657326 RepID=UPI003A9042A7